MSFTDAVKSVFSQYVGFKGRARRSEYWWFVLFNIIVSVVISLIARLTGWNFLSILYSLAVLLPGLAVAVRRLHDIGKSGWFYLFAFIPLVGAIILLVWFCKDSEPVANAYGPNPNE